MEAVWDPHGEMNHGNRVRIETLGIKHCEIRGVGLGVMAKSHHPTIIF
jgi:hypothetical protein